LTISSITLTGDFAVSSTTCVLSPATLAGNSTCSISVTFKPTASGVRSGTLAIINNSTNTPLTVSLTGTGSGLPSLTITASNATMKYGSAVPVITASYNPPSPAGLTALPICTTTATKTSPVGLYPTTCSAAAGPYTFTYVPGTLSVTPVPLTIWAPNVPNPPTPPFVVGSAIPVLAPSYVGFVAGDTAASLTPPPTCTTAATNTSPIGKYPITCSGAADPNYTISYVAGTLTISKGVLTITAPSPSMVYGGPLPALTPTYNPANPIGLTTPPTCTTTATASSPVGTYPVTCTGAASPNYTINYVAGTLTVTPKPLTITASSATVTYGAPAPAITPGYSGFVLGQGPGNLTGTVSCSTTYTQGSPVSGSPYPTTCSGATSTSYTISYVAGAITVNRASASVTPNAATKVYGTADPVPLTTGTLVGFRPADNVTATYTRSPGQTVAGSPYTISATLSPAAVLTNYTITYNTAAFTISRAAASVKPNAATKAYGTADPVPLTTGTLTGFLPADNVTATYTRTPGQTVAGSPYAISATLSPAAVLTNYAITYNTAAFTITPVPLTIRAPSPTMTYGGPLPILTPSYTGFVAGDTAASLTTQPTCTTTATASSPLGSYPVTCTGAVDPNYNITYSPGTLTIIAKPLTITASSTTVTYGALAPAITPSYSGFVLGQGPGNLTGTVTCSTAYTQGSPVSGSPYRTTCSGATSTNYTITYVPGTVTVNRAPLTIRASSATMTYGGPVPAITPSYSGFVLGQTSSVLTTQPTCSTAATSSSPVSGSPYPSSCTGAAAANYTIGYVSGVVTISKATTTATITSLAPNPSTLKQPVVVTFTVAPQFTGTPTGNVTVSASTGETCAGTVAARNCSIAFLTVGTRTLTAQYLGDGNFLTSTSPGVSQTVNAPTVSLTPPRNVTFGPLSVGTTSVPKTETVRNTGTGALINFAWSITGTNANNFRIASTTCTATLAPGAICVFNITFTPSAAGTRTASLTLTDNALNSPQAVGLSGTGL